MNLQRVPFKRFTSCHTSARMVQQIGHFAIYIR